LRKIQFSTWTKGWVSVHLEDAMSCNGVELGVIENHKGDSEWIDEHRWEIWGSTPKRGFGGRLLHRYSHGFSTLESAVKNLCMWKSGTIIDLV
jgi:hypothetical protein